MIWIIFFYFSRIFTHWLAISSISLVSRTRNNISTKPGQLWSKAALNNLCYFLRNVCTQARIQNQAVKHGSIFLAFIRSSDLFFAYNEGMDYRRNFRVVRRTSSLEMHEINCTRCKCSESVLNLVSRRFRLIPGLKPTVCNTMGMHHDHRSDKRAFCSLLNYNETCM